MLNFNQQKSRYLWLIEILQNYRFETNIVAKIADWDKQNGIDGFPNKYSLYIQYTDIPKSNMDLVFHLDQDGNWSKVEILNIDVDENYQCQGFGKRLIKHAINIAKIVGAKKYTVMPLKKMIIVVWDFIKNVALKYPRIPHRKGFIWIIYKTIS